MFERDDDPAFAGQVEYSGTKTKTTAIDRLPEDKGPLTTKVVRRSDLDSEALRELFGRLIGYYRREVLRQEPNRGEMGVDADFYDGDQYTDVDKQQLRSRGQEPLVLNVICTTINWLLGTERRGRTDYKILPRQKEAGKSAERKSQLLKYLADVNRAEFHVSRAFADTVKVGVGWMESGVQGDDEGEPIYERFESWRNLLWDSVALEMDLGDARYMFRSKWMDTDIAMRMFPERKYVIHQAASTTFDFMRAIEGYGDVHMDAQEEAYHETGYSGMDGIDGTDRRRVRMIEAWFRIPTEDEYVSGGQFAGELFDRMSPGHLREVEAGRATVIRKVRMRMHVAILTEAGLVYLSKSPYRHNRYPFTPIWCYRRDRDNMPYGVIRQLRGPQSDINKRFSKALYILSSNKTIMEKGAVKDLEAFQEEVARPDAIIVKEPGKHLELSVDRDLAPAHLDLMSRSISMIQQVGGVTDESLGRTTNAVSGKAITARQDQGSLATAPIFDNLRYARQIHGEKMLSLMEQFMDKQKQFRITNMRGQPQHITVNDGMPENDIIATKADFIISEDDFNATIRQAQVAELMELMNTLGPVNPGIVMATLDLLVETMDVPQREELVKRIRQITGAEDPDADPENPDPETIQRKKAAAKQAKMQERMAEAELADKEATAAEKRARATKIETETQKVMAEVRRILSQTAGENVETQVRALEAAAQIMGAQGLAGVADTILSESGFEGAGETAPALPAPAPAEPEVMP